MSRTSTAMQEKKAVIRRGFHSRWPQGRGGGGRGENFFFKLKDQTQTVLPEGLDFTYKVKRWQADARELTIC